MAPRLGVSRVNGMIMDAGADPDPGGEGGSGRLLGSREPGRRVARAPLGTALHSSEMRTGTIMRGFFSAQRQGVECTTECWTSLGGSNSRFRKQTRVPWAIMKSGVLEYLQPLFKEKCDRRGAIGRGEAVV